METMHYRERRKKGYKFGVFCFFLFVAVGAGIIYYGLENEPVPIVIGQNYSALEKKKMLEEQNALVAIYEEEQIEEVQKTDIDTIYTTSAVKYQDNSTSAIKADISVPAITSLDESLDDINDEIYDTFLGNFETYKESMKDADNDFTYKVTYTSYSNIVKLKKVLSIIITEKIVDDDTNKATMTKKYTYNIDLDTNLILSQSDVVSDIIGTDYLDVIKNCLKNDLVDNDYFTEDDYKYNYTGLETYYIKEGNLHIVFNSSQINTSITDLIDIEIVKEEE